MTHQYELMVILDPELDERTVAPSLDKFLTVITKSGGSIENVDIYLVDNLRELAELFVIV